MVSLAGTAKVTSQGEAASAAVIASDMTSLVTADLQAGLKPLQATIDAFTLDVEALKGRIATTRRETKYRCETLERLVMPSRGKTGNTKVLHQQRRRHMELETADYGR